MISLGIGFALYAITLAYFLYNFYKKFGGYIKDRKIMKTAASSYVFKDRVIILYAWYLVVAPIIFSASLVLLIIWTIALVNDDEFSNKIQLATLITILTADVFEFFTEYYLKKICIYILKDTLIGPSWYIELKNIHSIIIENKKINIKGIDINGIEKDIFIKNSQKLEEFFRNNLNKELFI